MKAYVSAELEAVKIGVIESPGEPNHGKTAVIKMYREYASLGYHSGYEKVERVTIIVLVEQKRIFCHKYQGSNLPKARAMFDDMAKLIRVTDI